MIKHVEETRDCSCDECFADCPACREERRIKKPMRPNVAKFLSYWQNYLKANGADQTKKVLSQGKTALLSNKDRAQLLKELELR